MIRLRMLGTVDLKDSQDREVQSVLRRPKLLALLGYLAAARPAGLLRRDTLVALLWPELDNAHARNSLRQAVHALRTALGREAVVARGEEEVGLSEQALSCDVREFGAALEAGQAEQALELYRGVFLEGVHVSDAPAFERWLDAERDHLRRRACEAAEYLADRAETAGNATGAVRWALRVAEMSPFDETAVRRLIQLLDRGGDRAGAVRAYEEFERRLERDLGVQPSSGTRSLVDSIRARQDQFAAPADGLDVGATARAVSPTRPAPTSDVGRGRRRVAAVSVLVLIAVLGGGLLVRAGLGTHSTDAARATRRILVLPFANLGPPEDVYLADGITQEITARLAAISALMVVGGQTAAQYKGSDKTPRRIAEELDVDYVLGGTVKRQRARSGSGVGRVQVRPVLSKARDEIPVWQAVLDEDAADMPELFAMLSGIAQRVVGELNVAVQPPQRAALSTIPTTDAEAYDYYLRGRELYRRTWTESNTRAMTYMFEQAVARDSAFGLAYAWLSVAHLAALWRHARSIEHLEQARAAAERALRLDPHLPDAHSALANYYIDCCDDYERALRHLDESLQERPGDPMVLNWIGNVRKRQGRWDDALGFYERAADLDPRWDRPLTNAAQAQVWLRRYDDADRSIALALTADPQNMLTYALSFWTSLLRDGDTTKARRVLREAARASEGYEDLRLASYLELLGRSYPAALRLAGADRPAAASDTRIAISAWDRYDWLANNHIRRGIALRLMGDGARARTQFDSARGELELALRNSNAASHRAQAWLRSSLAMSYGGLGRASAVTEQAAQVLAFDPIAGDALDGALVLENVARAYVLVGDQSAALDVLDRLLSVPARFSPQLLRLDPVWDPLRRDPRFEALAAPRRRVPASHAH